MQGLKWEFAVIDSDDVNAFVVPGGKVVVYTGLLRLLQGPAMETQLAAVLGHEIAHVVARHAVGCLTPSACSATPARRSSMALCDSLFEPKLLTIPTCF